MNKLLSLIVLAGLLWCFVFRPADAMVAGPSDHGLLKYKCVKTAEITPDMNIIPREKRKLWGAEPLCSSGEEPVIIPEGTPPDNIPSIEPKKIFEPGRRVLELNQTATCTAGTSGYLYADASQSVAGVGASAIYTFNKPYVSGFDHTDHSIAELAIRPYAGAPHLLEIVYGVDISRFSDNNPHLVVGYEDNGAFYYYYGQSSTKMDLCPQAQQ